MSPIVTLRPVTDADLDALYEFQADPVAVQMGQLTVRGRDDFFRHWRETVLPDAELVPRVIVVDGRVAGSMSSFRRPPGSPLNVGYILGRAFWGRGVATAALREFLSAHELRRPLLATVSVGNPASRRVLEKCGFITDGTPVAADDGVLEFHFRLER
jgi:RimJ/RimL family protein N-acetyltransferase